MTRAERAKWMNGIESDMDAYDMPLKHLMEALFLRFESTDHAMPIILSYLIAVTKKEMIDLGSVNLDKTDLHKSWKKAHNHLVKARKAIL